MVHRAGRTGRGKLLPLFVDASYHANAFQTDLFVSPTLSDYRVSFSEIPLFLSAVCGDPVPYMCLLSQSTIRR